MLSERSIINGLLLLAGVFLGPYLIILTFELNQIALLAFVGLIFMFCVFFFIKDRISIFPLLGAYISGSLNFLPLGLTVVELLSMMAIFYYLINYVALKRRPISGGPNYILFPMLIVAAIVIYHDHKLGLKVLGSSEEGSRPGLLILIAIVTYICGINIPSPSTTFLGRVPWYCFGLFCLGTIPFLLTTVFPSLTPYVYYISGNINLDAYLQSENNSDTSSIGRNGALLGLGATLQGVLVAYFPVSTWWRPKRWILLFISLLCLDVVLLGGYRNGLLTFILTTFFGAISYSRWRVLFVLPLLALIPVALIIVQNEHPNGLELPDTMQRSLSFFPGNWDEDVMDSAGSSNDFRENIKQVYIAEYLYKSPWIGNGFTFDPGESEAYETMAQTPGVSERGYFETKAFLVSKNFHVGWISLYDAVGIIGGLAFIMLNLSMIIVSGYYVFGRNADMQSRLFPLKVWLFCNLTVEALGYIITFGSFSASFVGLCGIGVILVHLDLIERRETYKGISPSSQIPLAVPNRTEVFSPLRTPSK